MDALTFLGTSGGIPMHDRCHASILLEAGPCRFLFDAGEPCSGRLKTLGVSFSSLDAVFITHGHSDHLSGLPMLIQGAWLERRKRPLPIYLPAELIEPLRCWLEVVYLPTKLIGYRLDFHALEKIPAEGSMVAETLKVLTNPTSHLDGLRQIIDPAARERFLAYSLALEWGKPLRRVVYSGDLGTPQDMDAILEKPCDLLVCELAHFGPEKLFAYLEGKSIRRLCLTHLTDAVVARAEEIEKLAARVLPSVETSIMHDSEKVNF